MTFLKRNKKNDLIYRVNSEWDGASYITEIYRDGSFKITNGPAPEGESQEDKELRESLNRLDMQIRKSEVETLHGIRNGGGYYSSSEISHMQPMKYIEASPEYEKAFTTLYAICVGAEPRYLTDEPQDAPIFEDYESSGIEFFGEGKPWIENPRYQYMLELIARGVVV